MSNVVFLGNRLVAKCRPGDAAFHKDLGWCTVTAADGLMREIEVLSERTVRDVATMGAASGQGDLLGEEVLVMEVFNVHVTELEEAFVRAVHSVDSGHASAPPKVLPLKSTFCA